MLISEKQIMELIAIASEYKSHLTNSELRGILTPTGEAFRDQVCGLIDDINKQQSTELKEIK